MMVINWTRDEIAALFAKLGLKPIEAKEQLRVTAP